MGPAELLARFVLFSRWKRKDGSVKKDAFIPQNSELSVTRHLNLSEQNIWNIGVRVAYASNRTLYGRADLKASNVIDQKLTVVPEPDNDNNNPNHANISNWPQDKNKRIAIALEFACSAHFVSNPEIKE